MKNSKCAKKCALQSLMYAGLCKTVTEFCVPHVMHFVVQAIECFYRCSGRRYKSEVSGDQRGDLSRAYQR